MAGGWTNVPNEILDCMADMSPAEFKVSMAIWRLIMGYKDYRLLGRRQISISDLQEITKLSRQGVVNTFDKIQEIGFFSKETEGRATIWIVNSVAREAAPAAQSGAEIVNSVDQGSQLSVPDSVNSVDHTTADTLYKNKKNKNIYIPVPGENITLQELPPEALPDFDYQERLEEMANAINSQVRDFYGVAANEKKFKDAADALLLQGVTVEKVMGFDLYWQVNGWYETGGKASLRHFLDHWDDYDNGVCLKKPAVNGHQPQRKPAPSQGLVEVEPGVY